MLELTPKQDYEVRCVVCVVCETVHRRGASSFPPLIIYMYRGPTTTGAGVLHVAVRGLPDHVEPHDLPHHRRLPRRHLLPHLAPLPQGNELPNSLDTHAGTHAPYRALVGFDCIALPIINPIHPPTHTLPPPVHTQVWLWYVSVTLLSFMLGFLLLRFLAFLLVWVGGFEFWFLPNLFDESLSFVDSFKPVSRFALLCSVCGVGGLVGCVSSVARSVHSILADD